MELLIQRLSSANSFWSYQLGSISEGLQRWQVFLRQIYGNDGEVSSDHRRHVRSEVSPSRSCESSDLHTHLFDRMDASIAMTLLQRIVSRGQDFCPKSSHLESLSHVQLRPKHTEIIIIVSPDGQSLRVETEIELVYKHEANGNTNNTYQLGTTRLFRNSDRDKRVEVTTVDIERY